MDHNLKIVLKVFVNLLFFNDDFNSSYYTASNDGMKKCGKRSWPATFPAFVPGVLGKPRKGSGQRISGQSRSCKQVTATFVKKDYFEFYVKWILYRVCHLKRDFNYNRICRLGCIVSSLSYSVLRCQIMRR
jgi:hypothetical protein